jgi:hypothetical protein
MSYFNRSIRLNKYGAPLDLRLALLVARTHAFIGNNGEAANFARWGLKNIGRATALTQDFNELVDYR